MFSTEGIVLKKIDAGETDALFVIYTKDFGKIRALAQGVKREEAKLKGHCEPLNLVSVQFVLGKSGERLTYAEIINSWPSIRMHLDKSKAAWYLVGLIDQHCFSGEKDEDLWNMFLRNLELLDRGNFSEEEMRQFLDAFDRSLVSELGYGVEENSMFLGAKLARPW